MAVAQRLGAQRLLAGLRVVDLGGEASARAARVLGDLGATVVRVVPPAGDILRGNVARAWNAGKRVVELAADDPGLDAYLAEADVVFDSPGTAGTHQLDPARAAGAAWVSITPFGLDGPRASWRASDLGVMASSGNMYCTGDPDRAPVRCTEPAAYAHTAGEAAYAALSALWSGAPQRVDVSMQEVVLVANMVAPANYPKTANRGVRRGANIGRTREIWPALDGFVSFGLRGGKARVASLETITKLVLADDIPADALTRQDWNTFNQNTASDAELGAIAEAVATYFSRHTMQELYDIACETNLMLAPANSPKEIYASAQLEARGFFGPVDAIERFPRSFVAVRSADGEAARVQPASIGSGPPPATAPVYPRTASNRRGRPALAGKKAWDGVRILEFGAGAAGPIATRYFSENGAIVLRIESRTRPDFLRAMALAVPDNPHGLEGAPMYDGLNVGKRNLTLNLKQPAAVEIVRRLVVEWADAVAENFAPRAMKSFGLDYDTLAAIKPDLVMMSACLNGQTGPHKNYPGFGGQGSALAGYNALTGWSDREPVGPYGTITDSLAPRYVAAALAAGLHYRRRTGHGVYLDLSQVESAIWTLAPWLLDYELDGVIRLRDGNNHRDARLHGAFACVDEDGIGDRWVTIACWTDDELDRLRAIAGDDVGSWTRTRTRSDVAGQLQAAGIEAVPVQDFADLHDDPQLAYRGHFEPHTHPFLGPGVYERNGFRLAACPGGYDRAGPTLGQDNEWALAEVLGLSCAEIDTLRGTGAVE
jgi:crotonobetainyl-CoA:carnitine CoA-transferase CaiB-like acyl-CoA transferase